MTVDPVIEKENNTFLFYVEMARTCNDALVMC